MKNLIVLIFVLVQAFSLTYPTNAQSKKDRVRTEKIGFFTRELQLSPKEAQVFWPVYDEYESKKQQINKKLNALSKQITSQDLNPNQIQEIDAQFIQLKQKQQQLFTKYHQEFSKVLGTKKTHKMYRTEIAFRSYLLKQLRESQSRGRRQ